MRRLSIIALFTATFFICVFAVVSVLHAQEPRPRPPLPQALQDQFEAGDMAMAVPLAELPDEHQELFMALTADEDAALAALQRRQANGSLPHDAYEITAEYLEVEKRRTHEKVGALDAEEAKALNRMLGASSFRPLMVHIDVDILLNLLADGFDPHAVEGVSEAYAATMAARFEDHLASLAQTREAQGATDAGQSNAPNQFERLW